MYLIHTTSAWTVKRYPVNYLIAGVVGAFAAVGGKLVRDSAKPDAALLAEWMDVALVGLAAKAKDVSLSQSFILG